MGWSVGIRAGEHHQAGGFWRWGQKVFVQVAPEDTDLPEKGVADEDLEAWRRIVDYLTESEEEREYFRAARFFRPLSLRWIGEEESEQGEDLLVGSGAAFI